LPGNPASALITFALLGMPLLRALQGDRSPLPVCSKARCGVDIRRNRDRVTLSLGCILERAGQPTFIPHPNQSSGATTALACSDGFAFIEPGDALVAPETSIDFLFWAAL
jgi:molybdopterin molybdotransferase